MYGGGMIDHFGVNCSVGRIQDFYDKVLDVLDAPARQLDSKIQAIGCGTDHPGFWIADASAGGPGAEPGGPHRGQESEDVAGVLPHRPGAGRRTATEPRRGPSTHDHYYLRPGSGRQRSRRAVWAAAGPHDRCRGRAGNCRDAFTIIEHVG